MSMTEYAAAVSCRLVSIGNVYKPIIADFIYLAQSSLANPTKH